MLGMKIVRHWIQYSLVYKLWSLINHSDISICKDSVLIFQDLSGKAAQDMEIMLEVRSPGFAYCLCNDQGLFILLFGNTSTCSTDFIEVIMAIRWKMQLKVL